MAGTCAWCGGPLPPPAAVGRPRRFCCNSHRNRSYEARRRITVSDVADRDGWLCHLCGGPVDPSASAPHPKAASVDHVLPLRRGGTDDLVNVRLAHFRCNVLKGDALPSAPRGDDPPTVSSVDLSSGVKHQLTNQPTTVKCRWCGRPIEVSARPGRRREFCKPSCRQMDYTARRRAAELGLGETELVMARAELDQLRDALYVLEAAVEDVDRDLAAADGDPDEVGRALDWLLQAARPLLRLRP